MANALEQISSLAVWGSLTASLVLGCSMLVQAYLFREYRFRFLCLAVLSFAIVLVDLSHASLNAQTYELLRVGLWSFYGPVIFFLFTGLLQLSLLAALSLLAVGFFSWVLVNPSIATTAVLPLTFTLAAFAHAKRYNERYGFGSCILLATSTAQAIACASYFWIMGLESPTITILGYAHYALISIAAVVIGWTHIPREMILGVPVRINSNHGNAFLATFIVAEFFAMPPFLLDGNLGIITYSAATMLQLVAILVLYFTHRYQLVIYTDNVATLLDERTQSLKLAREELAKQNDIQREKLQVQAKELQAKASVIERQSRLELAAQTTGQAAHDIQNLLSPFFVHLDRLRKSSSNTERVVQIADILKSNAEDLLNLNNQLLALSRRGRVEDSIISVEQLVESTLEQFPNCDHTMRITIEKDLQIRGSRAQLKRALSNLLINAQDACEGTDQRIVLSAASVDITNGRACHLGFLAPGEYIEIRIHDHGPGIPPTELEKIFDPFYSTKKSGSKSGSGLGLSIVAGVIEDHKGVIDVITSNEGTSFVLYFRPLEQQNIANFVKINGKPPTVLVMHDHSSWHSQLMTQLFACSVTTVLAENEQSALSLIVEKEISLFCFCQSTGESTFLDLYFKALHVQPTVKAVVISDELPAVIEQGFMQLGVEYFLQWPCSQNKLSSAIADTLRSITTAEYQSVA